MKLVNEQAQKVKMLTIAEAAKLTGIKPYTIRQWCISGELQHVKAGRGEGKVYLINENVLLAFLGQPA